MQLGIFWYTKEQKWEVKVAAIFFKKTSSMSAAIAIRDTCLLKLLQDPQDIISIEKKSQLQKAHDKISKIHTIKSNPDYIAIADEVYERYMQHLDKLKMATVSLPQGLFYNKRGVFNVKFQYHRIIYHDAYGYKDFRDALLARDALVQTLLDNNIPLSDSSRVLASSASQIPAQNMLHAKKLYDRARTKFMPQSGQEEDIQIEDDLIQGLFDAEPLNFLSSPTPTSEIEAPDKRQKFAL